MFFSILLSCFFLSFSCIQALNTNVLSLYPDLDEKVSFSGSKIGYGARYLDNGGDDYSGKFSLGPNYDDLKLYVNVNSKVSDSFYVRGEVDVDSPYANLQNYDQGDSITDNPILIFEKFGFRFIFPKLGVFSLGRFTSPTGEVPSFLTMNSGVKETFFEDVFRSGVYANHEGTDYFVGRMLSDDGNANLSGGDGSNIWAYGPTKGTRVIDGFSYTLPYKNWIWKTGYSARTDGFYKPFVESTLQYNKDFTYLQVKLLGALSSFWPYAGSVEQEMCENSCQVIEWSETGNVLYYSPYRYGQLASKISVGDMDLSISYASLFGNNNQKKVSTLPSNVGQWFFAADYTFADFMPFGSMSIGLGFSQRNNGFSKVDAPLRAYDELLSSVSLVKDSDALLYDYLDSTNLYVNDVKDSLNQGYVLSFHQKLGAKAGVRVFFEHFISSGNVENKMYDLCQYMSSSTNSDVISIYNDIEVGCDSVSKNYALDSKPIFAGFVSFYLQI